MSRALTDLTEDELRDLIRGAVREELDAARPVRRAVGAGDAGPAPVGARATSAAARALAEKGLVRPRRAAR